MEILACDEVFFQVRAKVCVCFCKCVVVITYCHYWVPVSFHWCLTGTWQYNVQLTQSHQRPNPIFTSISNNYAFWAGWHHNKPHVLCYCAFIWAQSGVCSSRASSWSGVSWAGGNDGANSRPTPLLVAWVTRLELVQLLNLVWVGIGGNLKYFCLWRWIRKGCWMHSFCGLTSCIGKGLSVVAVETCLVKRGEIMKNQERSNCSDEGGHSYLGAKQI